MNNSNSISNINTDKDLTAILSNFETEYIIHIVQDSLDMRFRPYGNSLPGLFSIEQQFQELIHNTNDEQSLDKIYQVREQTYLEILRIVCNYYNMEYEIDENQQLYPVVYWVYDFFVSNFTNTLIRFFVNYIFSEKTPLYNYLKLDALKKEKDNSTIYSKKICKDLELAIVHANLGYVLDNIATFDINFDLLLRFAADDSSPSVREILYNTLTPIGASNDIFKNKFAIYLLDPATRTDIITAVKLEIQSRINTSAQERRI